MAPWAELSVPAVQTAPFRDNRWAAGEEGPAQEEERRQAGLGWLGSLPSFFFFPFSFLYSNYSKKTI
jgi:hypothetical protein